MRGGRWVRGGQGALLLAAGCWLLAAGGEGFDSFLIRSCFTQQETKRGN